MTYFEAGESDARERIIAVALRLFSDQGYQAVTVRDIGDALGVRHTSLYHHFPDGKEELFIVVTARRMGNYRQSLEKAIQAAAGDAGDWQARLRAAAVWLLEQPAMHLERMLQTELSLLSEEGAARLKEIIFTSLLLPVVTILREGLANKPVRLEQSKTIAGMFYSLIVGIDSLPASYIPGTRMDLLDTVLDVFIHGLL